MSALVVADASPLIGLATARAFHVLRELYGTVTITRLLKDEVTGHADRPGARELEAAMRAGWIRVAPAPPETWTFPTLDNGEALSDNFVKVSLAKPREANHIEEIRVGGLTKDGVFEAGAITVLQ